MRGYCWEVLMDFTGAHVRRPSPLMWKTLKFLLSSLWEKKKWHWNKELTAVEPGTPGSEITELPTKPQGPWRVQVIEKAIKFCLWFLFLLWFLLFIFYCFFILYFVCFGKILSQLEAAPRALRSGNALRFLCSVEPRTQLLALLLKWQIQVCAFRPKTLNYCLSDSRAEEPWLHPILSCSAHETRAGLAKSTENIINSEKTEGVWTL